MQVYGENAKISHITSASKTPNLRSPVQDYTLRSPEYGQGVIESQVRSSIEQPSRFVGESRTLGLTDSGYSGAGSSRQNVGYEATKPTSVSGSGVNQSGLTSSVIKQAESQIGVGSSVQGAQTSSRYQPATGSISSSSGQVGLGSGAVYQTGTGATYQTGSSYPSSGSTYQYGTGSQSGATNLSGTGGLGSGSSYSTTLRSGSGYGATQQGGSGATGQAGTTQQGAGSSTQQGGTRFGSNYSQYRGV